MADQDPVLEGQDNPDEPDRPEWLPENFKTPEDLAASYKESQRKIHEQVTAQRNLEQMIAQKDAENEQLRAAQQQQLEPDPQPWEEWYATDPLATMRALAEQTTNQKIADLQASQQQQAQQSQLSNVEIVAGLATQMLEDRHGKLTEEQRTEMTRVATENPHLISPDAVTSPQKLAAQLDIIYKLAVPDGASSQQSQEELQRTMKMQAQSATGAGGRLTPADEDAQRWQEIMNANTGTWAEATRGK